MRLSVLTSSSLLILLAHRFAWRQEEPEGILPGCAAAALKPIPRANSSLTPQQFFTEHVLKGVPLLLSLDESTPALQHFLSACGDKRMNLLSTQQADVLEALLDEDLALWKWLVSNLVLLLTTGSTARGWAELRSATPRQLSEGPAIASFHGSSLASWLLQVFAERVGSEQLHGVSVIAKLIAQPVYLADKVVAELCPELGLDANLTKYEKYTLKELKGRKVEWQTLEDLEQVGLKHESEARIFYGGPKSYSYPLHRDLPDGDVLCVLHSGCKDVVILQPHARRQMARLKVPGFESISQFTWAYDFFSEPPISVDGWAGTLRAGELLYMPGEMLHHIRNSCRHSFTICRRPWRASRARDVALETLKTLRMAYEDETNVTDAIIELQERNRRKRR